MSFLVVLFGAVEIIGLIIAVAWWRDRGLPFPDRPYPQHIFRLVKREDRAAYVRIIRRTYAVQMRDMGRALNRVNRQIDKALLPSLRALADASRKLR